MKGKLVFGALLGRVLGWCCKLLMTWVCLAMVMICPPVSASGTDVMENLPDGLYAKMETNRGTIVLELHYKEVPLTVINFAGLAMGTMDTDVKPGEPFYDGLTFHRVIPDFMIQGGDPLGNGTGGPGYRFADEFNPQLLHDGAGVLSMANSGPNTNGSQFFITHKATPWLDFKHTVFGRVVKGQDVVDVISQGDIIKHLTIVPIGEEAKAFEISQAAFDRIVSQRSQAEKARVEEDLAKFKSAMHKRFPDAKPLSSGLMYVPLSPGTGEAAGKGSRVAIHFTGMLEDTTPFVSSRERGIPLEFVLGQQEVLGAWDIGVMGMKKGEKRRLLVPYTLGYGAQGYPGVIPHRATILFDVELVDIK